MKNFDQHLLLMFVCSVLSYTIVEIVKPMYKEKKGIKVSLSRSLSIILGGVFGYALSQDNLDILLGASAGALNAFLVAWFKGRLKKE